MLTVADNTYVQGAVKTEFVQKLVFSIIGTWTIRTHVDEIHGSAAPISLKWLTLHWAGLSEGFWKVFWQVLWRALWRELWQALKQTLKQALKQVLSQTLTSSGQCVEFFLAITYIDFSEQIYVLFSHCADQRPEQSFQSSNNIIRPSQDFLD